jgi:bifunctional non-homologous end joining protein LigD
MQAKLVRTLPHDGDWLYELKLDGYRAMATRDGNKVSLVSRNANDLTARFPAVVEGLRQLKPKQFVLDGEIVALDDQGRPSFQKLQHTHRRGSADHGYFYAFDLLNLAGRDLTRLPIEQRKELLASALNNAPARLRLSAPLEGEPATLIAVVQAHGLEGLVAKRKRSCYEPGKRSGTWLKYKCGLRESFVIGGYIPIRTTGVGIGALLVGYYDSEKRLQFAGRVGSGFTNKTMKELLSAFEHLRRADKPFCELPIARRASSWTHGFTRNELANCVWLEPKLACEVQFTEWTDEHYLRHPVFKGWRQGSTGRT